MKHFIDHAMHKAILLLNKKTGEECGKILAYYTDNPAGAVCHARVILYSHGWKVLGLDGSKGNADKDGIAGGYGYDKFSAAVADSLQKMGLGCTHEEMNIATFGNGTFGKESEEIKTKARNEIKKTGKIPVYSGSGNVREAFELYFRVIEAL
jgi:hypothetical protein